MVTLIFRWDDLFGVMWPQIPGDHHTLIIFGHVGLSSHFLIHIVSLNMLTMVIFILGDQV